MKRILSFCLVVAVAIGCNKDKFETKPHIKIKSTSSDIVPVNGILRVNLEFTDKEGDVANIITIKKDRLNQRAVATLRDSFNLNIPEFPNTDRGEIELDLEYQNHLISAQNPPSQIGDPNKNEADTLVLKFVLQDKAGNKSDTASANVIVIR
jgi:hypothetical protein